MRSMQQALHTAGRVDEVSASALKALLYFDLFRHPLTSEEIFSFMKIPPEDSRQLNATLNLLCAQGLVFQHGPYYAVLDERTNFEKRIRGDRAAAHVMPLALRRANLIARFPFVRGVGISGSLSKGYADHTTDVDFFIITEPGRLWVCRTLLVLFKKIFLFNSKKYFCVNYFIDTDNLLIPDQNVFTATEIATLLPVTNYELYKRFFESNGWIKRFFPKAGFRQLPQPERKIRSGWQLTMERLLRGRAGEWLDRFLFKRTLKHWQKRFGWQPGEEFELNMRSRRDVSKHHPQGFQFRVLKKYEERIRLFEEAHQVSLV